MLILSEKRASGKEIVMKKIYSALIVLLLFSLTITSCTGNGATQNHNTENASKEVILTADNIREYLRIEATYGSIQTKPTGGILYKFESFSDVNVSIYATSPGAFKNVKLTIGFNVTSSWRLSVSDPLYNDNSKNDYIMFTVILPADGNYQESHKLFYGSYDNFDVPPEHSKNPEIKISFVSGTFIPAY